MREEDRWAVCMPASSLHVLRQQFKLSQGRARNALFRKKRGVNCPFIKLKLHETNAAQPQFQSGMSVPVRIN